MRRARRDISALHAPSGTDIVTPSPIFRGCQLALLTVGMYVQVLSSESFHLEIRKADQRVRYKKNVALLFKTALPF